MSSILSYRKFIDSQVTRELRLPVDADGNSVGVELATVGALTYVSIPAGHTLPAEQPAEIAGSIQTVALDDAVRSAIKAASPHCDLIKMRRKQRILDHNYTPEDQFSFLHMAAHAAAGLVVLNAGQTAALGAYAVVCQEADTWASAQYTALGL